MLVIDDGSQGTETDPPRFRNSVQPKIQPNLVQIWCSVSQMDFPIFSVRTRFGPDNRPGPNMPRPRPEAVRELECPNCKRLFCAQFKVSWHAGITYAEFKRLNKDDTEKDDLIMEKLGYKKHWRKCPTCGIYVERSGGCTTIRCRCGTYFNFHCGRLGCSFCGKHRKKNYRTIGFFVFMKGSTEGFSGTGRNPILELLLNLLLRKGEIHVSF
ncbi:uncharacterized protein LOC133729889 [Rosa rugosa]|uniref:uncharacterized protein LOC133729889 n=1 Tax=Rosa rugosa TaxID=74645 RepID=UPI002B4103AF|nr:uncharacterized protein LOC133729889 [Rosa rugosa]